jgi:site-specific DNA-methyltransferase (adenine-specific)
MPGRNRQHPNEKPLGLVDHFISLHSTKGQTVLDPFMGSGTTGVSCANLGRKFIGIEIETKYFDIACRRIAEAYAQPRLFAEPTPKPVQTTLLGAE